MIKEIKKSFCIFQFRMRLKSGINILILNKVEFDAQIFRLNVAKTLESYKQFKLYFPVGSFINSSIMNLKTTYINLANNKVGVKIYVKPPRRTFIGYKGLIAANENSFQNSLELYLSEIHVTALE